MTAHMQRLNARATQARADLFATFAMAGERLQPKRLASETSDRFAGILLDTVGRAKTAAREHPLRMVGIAAAIGVFLARRPLFRLLSQGMEAGWHHFQKQRKPAAETDDLIAQESEAPHGT